MPSPKASSDDFPVLLCVPDINGPSEVHILPLGLGDYQMGRTGEVWKVVVKTTGELIYAGPGPVEVRKSPAPF